MRTARGTGRTAQAWEKVQVPTGDAEKKNDITAVNENVNRMNRTFGWGKRSHRDGHVESVIIGSLKVKSHKNR